VGGWIQVRRQQRSVSLFLNIPFKGSLTRDFRLPGFFINQFPPGPRMSNSGFFEFFESMKIREELNDTGNNLSLVPGGNDTGNQLLAGVVDTGKQLIAGVMRIFPRIFVKICNGPNGILRGLG
jgi:hypothetical protein